MKQRMLALTRTNKLGFLMVAEFLVTMVRGKMNQFRLQPGRNVESLAAAKSRLFVGVKRDGGPYHLSTLISVARHVCFAEHIRDDDEDDVPCRNRGSATK